MKTQRIFLFLFLLGVLAWTGCSLDPQGADAPVLQGARPLEGGNSGPTGPCDCLDCRYFSTSQEVIPFPDILDADPWDFAIQVKKTQSCSALSMSPIDWGNGCAVTSEQRRVHLNMTLMGAPGALPWDVFDIMALGGLGGGPINNLWGDDAGDIYVDDDAVIYFRWKNRNIHTDPNDAYVSSGGICIIGIMTEPYWPRPNWGGRYPARLHKLH